MATPLHIPGDLCLRKVRAWQGEWTEDKQATLSEVSMFVYIIHQSHWGYYLIEHLDGTEELVPPETLIKLTFPD